jgi:hypothetical protein
MLDPDCHFGDHLLRGGARCVRAGCGFRLRCMCGRFIREDALHAHEPDCPALQGLGRPDETTDPEGAARFDEAVAAYMAEDDDARP